MNKYKWIKIIFIINSEFILLFEKYVLCNVQGNDILKLRVSIIIYVWKNFPTNWTKVIDQLKKCFN